MDNERKQKVLDIYAGMIAEHGGGRVYGQADTLIDLLRDSTLPPGMIVDVGSGNGAITEAVARAFPLRYVMGIDFSPEQLAYAHANHSTINLMYSHGDADDLPYIHAAAIYSAVTFQYVDDVRAVLRTIHDRLNPGGLLWFSVQLVPVASPAREAIRAAWQGFIHHSVSFDSEAGYVAMLGEAGFSAIQSRVRTVQADTLTPKRQEILVEKLGEAGLTVAECDAAGWLAIGEFNARKNT